MATMSGDGKSTPPAQHLVVQVETGHVTECESIDPPLFAPQLGKMTISGTFTQTSPLDEVFNQPRPARITYGGWTLFGRWDIWTHAQQFTARASSVEGLTAEFDVVGGIEVIEAPWWMRALSVLRWSDTFWGGLGLVLILAGWTVWVWRGERSVAATSIFAVSTVCGLIAVRLRQAAIKRKLGVGR